MPTPIGMHAPADSRARLVARTRRLRRNATLLLWSGLVVLAITGAGAWAAYHTHRHVALVLDVLMGLVAVGCIADCQRNRRMLSQNLRTLGVDP